MSPEAPKEPIINGVPGMEPYTGKMPSREVISTPADQATAAMRANAMYSPDNIHPGAFMPEAAPESAEQAPAESAEAVGATVIDSLVEVEPADGEEAPVANEFDSLFSPDAPEEGDIDAAAYQSTTPNRDNAVETAQQMGVSAAARKLREEAGLPPRPYDLR